MDARVVIKKIVDDVKKLNPRIKPLPILLTKYVNNSAQSREMKSVADDKFASGVFNATIPYSNIIAKSHSSRQSIHEHSPGSLVAQSYDKVALAIGRFVNKKKK